MVQQTHRALLCFLEAGKPGAEDTGPRPEAQLCLWLTNLWQCLKYLPSAPLPNSEEDESLDLPDGSPVVKNPPANAGDVGLIPSLGRVHKPRGDLAHSRDY